VRWPGSRWRSEAVLEVQQAEIDGVPVFWAETSAPEFHAALIFRVGRADEPMPLGGVTHLIQEMALRNARGNLWSASGFVDINRTAFHADGERSQVLEFISWVAATLGKLPLDQVDHSRKELKAELAGWMPNITDRLLTTRFGAHGFGIGSYRELGLEWIGRDQVGAWAGEHFTRGNAALCMSGPPPDDLKLALPDGPRRQLPPLEPLPLEYPLQFSEGAGGVALAGIVERTPAAALALDVFNSRATAELGPTRRVAHEVGPLFTALTADAAQLGFVGRAANEKAPDGRDGLMFVVEKLRDEGPTEQELAAAVERTTRPLSGSAGELAILDRAATAELDGREQVQPAELAARYASLTGDELRPIFDQLARTFLVIMPTGAPVPPGYHAPPGPLSHEFSGREFKGPGLFKRRKLTVASDGLSVITPNDGTRGVRFNDVVALVQEGHDLTVLARDKTIVRVPEDFGDDAHTAVREALPETLYVPDVDHDHSHHHHHDHNDGHDHGHHHHHH
jgi:hypothetical protein